MSGEFGPGEVYNRRVTKHLQALLPDRTRSGDDYTFGGRTVLDSESNPGKPAGGTCQIRAYVGGDGQITVLERSRITSGTEVLWASRNLIRRTHAVDGAEMEPFRYHVVTEIQSGDTTKENRTRVNVSEFTEKPIYGGREAQAAVLLAERVAVEKVPASARQSCCSLQDLPSFPRVIGKGWLELDWADLDDLLGPDADTIAADVSLDSLADAEREAAATKGIEIFTDADEDLQEEVGERTPANAASPHPWDNRDEDQIPTELPDDVGKTEAQRQISEMLEQVQGMQVSEDSDRNGPDRPE